MELAEKQPETPRPRRDRRRERNRQALVTAAVQLLMEGGSAALSPVRITRLAGLHKPAFYAHFASVEECQQEVARYMLSLFYEPRIAERRTTLRRDPTDRASHYAWHLRSLEGARHEERAFYRMLPRLRYEQGPVGDCIRTIVDQVRRDWVEINWEVALRYGIGAAHLHEVQALTVTLIELAFSSLVRVANKEITDLEAEAARLQRYDEAIITAELRRMLGFPPETVPPPGPAI